jgi:hypothetical protein
MQGAGELLPNSVKALWQQHRNVQATAKAALVMSAESVLQGLGSVSALRLLLMYYSTYLLMLGLGSWAAAGLLWHQLHLLGKEHLQQESSLSEAPRRNMITCHALLLDR